MEDHNQNLEKIKSRKVQDEHEIIPRSTTKSYLPQYINALDIL